MADSARQVLWLQGNVLTDEAAKTLGLRFPKSDRLLDTFVVVISHDCDLAAAADKEAEAEVVVGWRIATLGADSYAKTARRLHFEYQSDGGPVPLELLATSKQSISKAALFATDPRRDMTLEGQGLRILQRWLAARYSRAAFPEAFEDRLRDATIPGKLKLLKKIQNILAASGDHIRALMFDLDQGVDVERSAADDLYQLGIVVLYDGGRDEPTAAAAATKASEELESLFELAFLKPTGAWKNIQLKYCDPVSDNAITVAQSEAPKQWRLEHMSLQDESPLPMLSL